MPNTYSQIYLQFVFIVKNRRKLILAEHKEQVHRYMTGLVQKRNAKMLAIHAMPDHLHMLVGLAPVVYIPDFVKEIKVASTGFINQQPWIRQHFKWQTGYGVFSYSRSQIGKVASYIDNQEKRHARQDLHKEYVELLRAFQVEYEEKYLFDYEKPNES